MKFWLVLILVCFAVGIWLLEIIQSDAGYVLISLNSWTFETSFWFALSVIIVSLLCVYFFWRVVKNIFLTLISGGRWFKNHRSESMQRHYREGLLSYLTGDFKRASKELSAISRRSELPVVRVIASAQALAYQGHLEDGINMLREAEEKYPQDAVWLQKALVPLLVKADLIDEVDVSIEQLKQLAPGDPTIPRLEHLKLNDQARCEDATRLLADKKHLKSLGNDDLEQTYILGLQELAGRDALDREAVDQFWRDVPKALKTNPSLLLPYAKLLLSLDEHAELEKLVTKTQDKQWLPELLDLYAKLDSDNCASQLKKAEKWLSRRPDDAALLLCLGVLSIKNQYWGKARSYFEQANQVNAHPRALYFLGYIAEHLGEADKSHEYYKQAAELGHLS